MQYRNFGRIPFRPSALGFGAMRLPTIGSDSKNINDSEAVRMLRYAIDNGVNYIDTAWPYHGGESEVLVAKALESGYSDKVKIATKLPSWAIEKSEDMDEYLNKQLKKLKTEKIDFYLLHSLDKNRWANYKKLDVFGWIDRVKKEGKIDYIGFSFHDDVKTFKRIIDEYKDWDLCQIQYNFLNTDYQAGTEGLKYAAARGLGVVVMEPLLGGRLAGRQPPAIEEIWNNSGIDRSPVDWALSWLWNQPEVSVVLSGMSTFEQVKENVELAANSGVNVLSEKELSTIKQVAAKYRKLEPINCTGCSYCMPCSSGVNIPGIFSLYNEAKVNGNYEAKKKEYNNWPEEWVASRCKCCGVCEKACPQKLKIMDLLKKVDKYFNG